jgi:uncharacterized protein YndB with AHSA1/START domain
VYSSVQIDITASPARVFAVLTDPKLMRSWNPEIVEMRQPEELKVGDVSHAVVQEFGRRFSVEVKLKRREPDRAIGYDMTTPSWSGYIEYILTEVPSGTNVDFRFQPVAVTGWKRVPARWMAIVIRPLIRRHHRARLEALRTLIERREANAIAAAPSVTP